MFRFRRTNIDNTHAAWRPPQNSATTMIAGVPRVWRGLRARSSLSSVRCGWGTRAWHLTCVTALGLVVTTAADAAVDAVRAIHRQCVYRRVVPYFCRRRHTRPFICLIVCRRKLGSEVFPACLVRFFLLIHDLTICVGLNFFLRKQLFFYSFYRQAAAVIVS